MTAGLPMKNCPSAETLSAFMDGRLDAQARRSVVEHLADCAECRDVVLMADELAAAGVVGRADNVVRGRFRSRVMPASLAAAAAVVMLFLIPTVWERLFDGGTSMERLADAAERLERRPSDARLNTEFDDYKPVRMRPRGGGEKPLHPSEYGVAAIESRLASRQEEGELSVRDLHVLGVSQLLRGKDSEAIQSLEGAVKRDTGTNDVRRALAASKDVALLTDLVSAYRARADVRGGDPARASGAAERAWRLEQTATTAWNRALTLQSSNPSAALAAWDDYLRIDDNSLWAEEAISRKENLSTKAPHL